MGFLSIYMNRVSLVHWFFINLYESCISSSLVFYQSVQRWNITTTRSSIVKTLGPRSLARAWSTWVCEYRWTQRAQWRKHENWQLGWREWVGIGSQKASFDIFRSVVTFWNSFLSSSFGLLQLAFFLLDLTLLMHLFRTVLESEIHSQANPKGIEFLSLRHFDNWSRVWVDKAFNLDWHSQRFWLTMFELVCKEEHPC